MVEDERPPQQELQRILDAVLAGVIVLAPAGAVQRINAEACRIIETSLQMAPGRSLATLLHERHPLLELARNVQSTRRPVIEDGVAIARRFGGDLEVEVAVSPLPEENGDTSGVVLLLRDRAVGKSLREQASQREQLASYGLIAAGIAHEVKNPLSGIRGAAELLSKWTGDARGQQSADLIIREVDRITRLVEELMVFARGDELMRESLNLHRLLDQVLELVAAEPAAANAEFERNYDPSIPDLMGDANRLTQVFLNLARNAVQAMGEAGGRLSVTTRTPLRHRLVGADGRPVPTIEITIGDTGPGIPDEIADRLATPFFTTKPDGTGLGLAVSRHWLTRHGGRMQIESEPGLGTKVRVSLPLQVGGAQPAVTGAGRREQA